MEITRLHAADRPPAASSGIALFLVPVEVDDYLEALRHEHQRFLQAMGAAGSCLGDEHPELASAAAVHGRLTRQFLDAQRSILRRRAEVAAEVSRLECEAAASSSTIVATAQRRAAAMRDHPAGQLHPRLGSPALVGVNPLLGGRRSAPLDLPAARSRDVAALVGEIDGVFEITEAEGVAEQRQLAELLDSWWSSEQQEASAAIDDAHARAAVRQHVAVIEASTAIGEGPEHDGSSAARWLPREVTAVLELAVAADLENVLVTLIASLQSPVAAVVDSSAGPEPTVEAPLAVGAILRFETIPAAGADEAFRDFWAKEPVTAPPARRMRWWTSASLMVPITLVSSVIVFAAAWVG